MLDKNRTLPELQDPDPRRMLSRDARIRIDDAVFRAMALRKDAFDLSLQMKPRDARIERLTARKEAAFIVLEAVLREFRAIGKTGHELIAIMTGEMEDAEYSLELTTTERDAVWSRLYTVRDQGAGQLETTAAVAADPLPISAPKGFREDRLQAFIDQANCSIADVFRTARVDKNTMRDWRREILSDESSMAQRIERVLAGLDPIKRGPGRQRSVDRRT